MSLVVAFIVAFSYFYYVMIGIVLEESKEAPVSKRG